MILTSPFRSSFITRANLDHFVDINEMVRNRFSSGFATLQKALDENPSKIIIENGDYFQSATKSGIQDLTIMPLDPQGAPVRMLGGREIKTLIEQENKEFQEDLFSS